MLPKMCSSCYVNLMLTSEPGFCDMQRSVNIRDQLLESPYFNANISTHGCLLILICLLDAHLRYKCQVGTQGRCTVSPPPTPRLLATDWVIQHGHLRICICRITPGVILPVCCTHTLSHTTSKDKTKTMSQHIYTHICS